MSQYPIGDIAFKALSFKSFYMYMQSIGFPLTTDVSYALGFFILPMINDEFRIMIDLPSADEVTDYVNNTFRKDGAYSPLFTYYINKHPDYDKTKLFCEVYNVIHVTPFNSYIPPSRDPEQVKISMALQKIKYVRETALKNPILCTDCVQELIQEGLAAYDNQTKLFYFDYRMLPKNTQNLIQTKNMDTAKYLFSREVYMESMTPLTIPK